MEEKKDTLELDLAGLDGVEPAPSRMTQEYMDFLKSQEDLVVFDHIPGAREPDQEELPEERQAAGETTDAADDSLNESETDETQESPSKYTDDYYESWE